MCGIGIITFLAVLLVNWTIGNFSRETFSIDDVHKASELLQEAGNEEEALRLLDGYLEVEPNNTEALKLISVAYLNLNETDNAYYYTCRAIRVNKPHKSGVTNSSLLQLKALVLEKMEDYDNAFPTFKKCMDQAVKDDPGKLMDYYCQYAEMLCRAGYEEDSDAMFRTVLKDQKNCHQALVGLSKSLFRSKQYEAAAELCERAIKAGGSLIPAYRVAMLSYDRMGENRKAIDKAVCLLDSVPGEFNQYISKILLSNKNYSEAALKSKVANGEKYWLWATALARFYQQGCDYEKAIEQYNIIEEIGIKGPDVSEQKSVCYEEMGRSVEALNEIINALDEQKIDGLFAQMAAIFRNNAKYDEAIKAYDAFIELRPTLPGGYFEKGWCYDLSGDADKALALYNQSIDINDEYPYTYYYRGLIYLKQGNNDAAIADFEKVLDFDTDAVAGSCRQFALHFLGKDEEAEEWMAKVIEDNPYNSWAYYDKACLLALSGRGDEAVKSLEECFQKGYRHFSHIEHDFNIEPIRGRSDFQNIFNKYKDEFIRQIQTIMMDSDPGYDTPVSLLSA